MRNNQLSFGDRMKSCENCFNPVLLPNAIYVARLDGNSFSKFTKSMNFNKPFDLNFVNAMKNATKRLVKETQAVLGYTQSDEVTLILTPERMRFNGRLNKLCSIMASKMSVFFYQELLKTNPDFEEKLIKLNPVFDCRVFSVPSKKEALNAVLWREQDAVKNSILCTAQSFFSHKEMFKLNTKQLVTKMEREKNYRWDELPIYLKRGSYFIYKTVEKEVDPELFYKMSEKQKNEVIENNYKVYRTVIEEDESFLSLKELPEDYFF